MDQMQLNEHDANQGAQSKGEFLGMTGNSGWYLLGSAGLSLLIVIFCWGVLGVSLLLCLFLGVMLCAVAVAYVFALKNNRPEHYDTDFFEAALVDAGVLELTFGPRVHRPPNPFLSDTVAESATEASRVTRRSTARTARMASDRRTSEPTPPAKASAPNSKPAPKPKQEEPVVALAAYETLCDELAATQEWLEDALVERGEI